MKRFFTLLLLLCSLVSGLSAANVKVTMSSTSRTMTLTDKATGTAVAVGEPTSYVYNFEAPAGTYVLTAFASDGTTVNGTIEVTVVDGVDNEFKVLTCTAYATNKDASNNLWVEGTDYTLTVDVNTREGEKQAITIGNSTTAGRKTFLALNGNSYYASFVPNAAHQAEGYMTLYKGGTLTFGATVSGAIPMGADYSITVPANAEFQLGMKFAHFIDFTKVEPTKTETAGDVKTITYRLANSQAYNYRTWREGGLTQAGYFYMNTDAAKCPQLAFTAADYEAFAPKTIKHDVQWNGGYETGDIFVNINQQGHLKLNVGDTYDAHAMRTWELTDNSTNNYFIEPDFHYTVINPDGTPSTGVIEIEGANTTTSPWSTIKAVGKGTAIVLVTYDAIGLNYYGSGKTEKTTYMGGEYWSAIWPENTAAYVVTVGADASSVVPNMVINEAYNLDTKKNAGKYVDAEHDVFYYLDTEKGANYTFTPTGAASVEIAYPTIGEQMATYTGFASTGVTKNADGSYTLLLKEGRQIVRLTDAAGNATYQVLTAKSCHREITNVTRPEATDFQRGDQITIQYSGLRHPANKMAGIYNMSAYVTYNGTPNGTSLILGAGQYTFGSVAKAQAVTVTIPQDFAGNEFKLSDGVIQVNGYGDPIGNHRFISRVAGRSANFTAIAHKTYFGAIPEIVIPVTTPVDANITFEDVALAQGATYYNGADGAGLFTSDDFSFMSYYDNTYGSWSGFALSCTTGNTYSGSYTDDTQYNSCVGGGMNSKQFAVGYYSEYGSNFGEYPEIYATKNFKPQHVYVTNTAYTLKSMNEGDSYAKKFTADDYLLLTITGLDKDDNKTGQVNFYLAKDGNKVTEWTKVDLTPLGTVDHIRFTMDSSDKASWGIQTPTYFAIDNMKAILTDDLPTSIKVVPVAPSVDNGIMYNLSGQRVGADYKGIVIKNGKKYINK